MGRFSLNYADVVEMEARHTSRLVDLEAAGFIILLDLLHELSFRNNWNNDGAELTDNQWDIAENWIAAAATALMTVYECPDEEPPNGESTVSKYAILQHQEATTDDGGSCAATTWQQVVINTELSDPHSLVTLSNNKFTPINDEFRIAAIAAAFDCNTHRIRLYNVTADAVVDEDMCSYSNPTANVANNATLSLLFSPNGTDEYRIDHYTREARSGNGLGISCDDGSPEVYVSVLLEVVDEA